MITSSIIGALFIAFGFLVARFPNLIAGYNTMRYDKKKNVDIDGLSAFMKKGFIILGATIIVLSSLVEIFRLNEFSILVMVGVTLIGVTIIIIKGQKYDHNVGKYRKFFTYFGIVAALIFVMGIMINGFIPTRVVLERGEVQFTGHYGVTLNLSDIETVELLDKIPKIRVRTGGFDAGIVKKGHFRLDSWEKSRLFLHSNEPPFLVITTNNGSRIIFNNRKKSVTENAYSQIKLLKENE